MKTSTVLCIAAFTTSAIWALFIPALCEVWHWPWWASLITFVVIFPITLFVLCLVNVSGGAVRQ